MSKPHETRVRRGCRCDGCLLVIESKKIASWIKKRRPAYREQMRPYFMAYRQRAYVKIRKADEQLRTNVGITLEQKEQAVLAQGSKCRLCGTADPGHKYGWAADHDHASGVFRGILCRNCNVGLGYLGDNVPGLRRALTYLEGHAPGIGTGLL